MKLFTPPLELAQKYQKYLQMKHFSDLFKICPISKNFNPAKEALLIRHALSDFNYSFFEKELEYGDQTLEKMKIETSLLDSNVHELGAAHAAQASLLYHKLTFQKVLVSPMRRTLSTMVELFKAHPERQSIHFILVPQLRELFESIGDISSLNINHFEEQQKKLKQQYQISLDLSLMKAHPYAWQLETMREEMQKDAREIIKQIQELKLEGEAITQFFIKRMIELFKNSHPRYQSLKHLYLRSQDSKKLIQSYLEEKQDPQKVLGVVSHSALIRNMTAKYFDEQVRKQIGGYSPMNCEGLWIRLIE